jgi:hypothetical protein
MSLIWVLFIIILYNDYNKLFVLLENGIMNILRRTGFIGGMILLQVLAVSRQNPGQGALEGREGLRLSIARTRFGPSVIGREQSHHGDMPINPNTFCYAGV